MIVEKLLILGDQFLSIYIRIAKDRRVRTNVL